MQELMQTLTAMIDAHTRLLELAKEKQNVLIAGNSDALETVVSRETSCINEIQKLEQQRESLVQKYMTQKGILGHSFTLQECINATDNAVHKTMLAKLADELLSLIQELADVNETNQHLIQTSLSYIQYSLSLYMPKEPSVGYGPKAGKRYSSLLDAKV